MKQCCNFTNHHLAQSGHPWSIEATANRTAIKELENFLHNSTTVDDFWILFVNAGLLNHSCAPNAASETFVPKDKNDIRAEVRAIKDINKGEEITIFYNIYKDYSYKVFGSTIEERKIAIKKNFDFDCKCCLFRESSRSGGHHQRVAGSSWNFGV